MKGSGLLNRLQPFMPKVDWSSAGSFDLSARLVRGANGTKLTDIRVTTGFLTVSGDAEFGDGASRVTLNLTGNLARLPKGLMPEKFAAEGTFTSGPITVTTGGGAMNASGSVAFRDFAVGGAARSATASLNFAVAKAGDSTRIDEVRFIADRTDVLLKGTMAGGRFEGALDARADLAIVPPSMLPKGYAGSGPMQAKLDIAGETGTLTASATGLRLTSATDQPMEFGDVRFTGRPSWRQGDKYAALADGRFTVANLKLRDYNITTGTVYPVTFADGVLLAPTGDFAMNGGTIALRECTVDIRGEKPVYSLRYDVQKVQMAQRMGPEAKYLSPIFGGTSGLSGILQTKGLISDKGDANGLTGEVGLLLNEGTIKGSPVLTAILAWLKRETQLNFTEIAGNLKLGAGRIETAGGPLRIVAPDMTILLEGFTDMKGPVDYHVRVKFPEGSADDSKWKKALRDGVIPMRLTGTLDSPSVAPPALDKLAESVLDDLFKKGLKDGLGGLLPK